MAAFQHVELAFRQFPVQTLRVRYGDERIVAAHRNLARCLNFGQTFRKPGERIRISSDVRDCIPEALPSVGCEIILQREIRELVLRHVLRRAPDELFAGEVLVRLERRRIDDLVENSADIGVIGRAASDHHAFECTGMIGGGEQTSRSTHIGSD